jgi:hypothetical protein
MPAISELATMGPQAFSALPMADRLDLIEACSVELRWLAKERVPPHVGDRIRRVMKLIKMGLHEQNCDVAYNQIAMAHSRFASHLRCADQADSA